MNYLGINVGFSRPASASGDAARHPLSDGSAALISDDGLEFATIEERHTETRYSGGFAQSLRDYCKNAEISLEEGDVVAISSCCGPRWSLTKEVEQEIFDQFPEGLLSDSNGMPSLVVVDHHESHAASAFYLSGAQRALVAVLDGFGNLLDIDGWDPDEWWRGQFERHSYYVAERKGPHFGLDCVSRDATGFDDVGLGEVYRALTHFCGWSSYQQAGSAMALAAFGAPDRYQASVIDVDSKVGICSRLANDHPNPQQSVLDAFELTPDLLPEIQGRTASPNDVEACSVVATVQRQLVEAVCERLLGLARQHDADTIVVSGGVAMNCLAMGELQRRFDGRVYVPPAPSDTGQALGNAIWARHCISSPQRLSTPSSWTEASNAPFWGIDYRDIHSAVQLLSYDMRFEVTRYENQSDQVDALARLLESGKVVAVCQGRSGYGPRALGDRSILADPRRRHMPERVNRFKGREIYRPFAPAILKENLLDYFKWEVDSPYMSFAVEVTDQARLDIPSVVHADGTARVQTVDAESISPLRPILEAFYALTGVPLLLNTSFNRKGQPMVDSNRQAVKTFERSTLDALSLDGFIINRKQNI